MKTSMLPILLLSLLLTACGGLNSFPGSSSENNLYFDKTSQLARTPNDTALQAEFTLAYANAVSRHRANIARYETSGHVDQWERIMKEYVQLNRIAEAAALLPLASQLVKIQRYDTEYANAREQAANSYYMRAQAYLNSNNRNLAMQAYELLQKTNQIIPGYRDVSNLMNIASQKSILHIVVNPVNYYAQSFQYWGLSNDYVQYQLTNDLRYQLGNSNNIRVYTDREAYNNNVYPDRVVDISWNELYMPMPTQQTFTRQVSKQIQTGKNADNQPIFQTVSATLYITRKTVQARGTLSCRITEPGTNRTLLFQNYPGGYNWQQEFATYKGDSRALGNYEWALINNRNMNDPTRNNLFNEVLQQVYPQLMNSIRSVTWYG